MAVVALVVSVLALASSIASAFYTRSVAQTEADRRHDESIPDIEVETVNRTTVRFTNHGPKPLDDVTYELSSDDGTVAGSPPIVWLSATTAWSESLGSMEVGVPVDRLAVEREDGIGGSVRLRLTCCRGNESWVLTRTVTIEGAPKIW